MNETARHVVVGVDDDYRVRESIASLVESAGYAPSVFSSAEQFLESGSVAGAACVITDVRMPGIDGLELARRIRLCNPRLPIIFISAHYDDRVRQRALEEGAIGFLFKPFDAVELLDAIHAALVDSQGKVPE